MRPRIAGIMTDYHWPWVLTMFSRTGTGLSHRGTCISPICKYEPHTTGGSLLGQIALQSTNNVMQNVTEADTMTGGVQQSMRQGSHSTGPWTAAVEDTREQPVVMIFWAAQQTLKARAEACGSNPRSTVWLGSSQPHSDITCPPLCT